MLAPLDRKTLFGDLERIFGLAAWTAGQVSGLDRLLDGFQRDPLVPDGPVGVRRCAYFIQTSWHETGHTFEPVRERGSAAYFVRMYGPATRRGRALGNDTNAEAIAYSGKGDVQLTGENNYERLEALVREHYPWVVEAYERDLGRPFDLTVGDQPGDDLDPDGALYPPVSYVALVAGTTYAMFGPPISKFINEHGTDYYNARRCVNVLDHAELWRANCPKIEAALAKAIAAADASAAPTGVDAAAVAAGGGPEMRASGTPAATDTAAPLVGSAETVVNTAPAPPAGDAPSVPAVTANKQSLITKINTWAGSSTGVAFVVDQIAKLTGLSAQAQLLLVGAVIAFGMIGAVAAIVDHLQTKNIAADTTKANVK